MKLITAHIALVTSLMVPLPPMALARTVPSDSIEARIIDFITHPPIDTVPYEEIEAFGISSLPTIRRLLSEPRYEGNCPHLILLLGAIGDASDTQRLRAHIENRFSGEISEQQLRCIVAALTALGSLSDRDPSALTLLRQYANPKAFARVRFRTRGETSDQLGLYLSKISINGIGLSGRQEAGAVLSELAKHPHNESQVGNLKDAVARHSAIMKVGRARHVQELRRMAREEGEKK